MKKNNLINKNVISAISVALSATMAVMSPVSTLAETTDNTDPATDTSAENTINENEITDAAQEAAEDTADAVESASDEIGGVLDEMLGEDGISTEDGGAIAADAVEAVVDAANTLADDESLINAGQAVEDVKADLVQAEEADAEANADMDEAVTAVAAATELAELAEKSVEASSAQAAELTDEIENAATSADAEAAYDKLGHLVDDTVKDIEAKKEAFNELSVKYDEAILKLRAAEQKLDASLDKATADVNQAKAELDTAKKNVEALEEALEEAGEKLDIEAKAAQDIQNEMSTVKNTWDSQRKLQQSVILNYYVPQLLGPDVTDVTFTLNADKGFTGQDSSRFTLKYKDADGNDQVKYFNYDRIDRTYKSNNQWADLGKSQYIVIFEKSAEEVAADKYAAKYYKDIKAADKSFTSNYNKGKYDVYAYEEGGVTKFAAIDEINNGLAEGTVTEEDGVYFVNGNAARKVVQTTANTCDAEKKINVTNDEAFVEFYKNAGDIADKYEEYGKAVEKAASEVEDAVDEAQALSDAIDALKNNRSSRTVSAARALGVDDVAAYLELEVSGDEAAKLNQMSLDEVIEYLNSRLDEAKEKIDNAELKLDDLKIKYEEAQGKLDEVLSRLNVVAEEASEEVTEETVSVEASSDFSEEAAPAAAVATAVAPTAGGLASEMSASQEIGQANPSATGSVLGLNRAQDLDEGEEVTDSEASEIKETTSKAPVEAERKIVTIEDTKTALASDIATGTADGRAMSWWWIILAAIMGATGREMYRRYEEKKAAKIDTDR